MSASATGTIPQELILGVFLHGFKGGADTFASFPERLQVLLDASSILFEPVVYPAYDTRGELVTAGALFPFLSATLESPLSVSVRVVDNHVVWLTELVAEKKALFRERGGTGPVRVVLFGHSCVFLLFLSGACEVANVLSAAWAVSSSPTPSSLPSRPPPSPFSA
jgi:hypothetical protein